MDCDQVFVILTRGPFPTVELWDEEVEAHLEMCTDCWRLAEALRPALEVFQEAVPPAESRDLPGYWGDARPHGGMVSALNRPPARMALATGVRRAPRQLTLDCDSSRDYLVPPDILRAMVFASTVTATAIGAGLMWLAW